jgi:hypothetical protein
MVLYDVIVGLVGFSERSEQGHLPCGWVPRQSLFRNTRNEQKRQGALTPTRLFP